MGVGCLVTTSLSSELLLLYQTRLLEGYFGLFNTERYTKSQIFLVIYLQIIRVSIPAENYGWNV